MLIDAHVHIANSSVDKKDFTAAAIRLLKEMKINRVDHVLILPDLKKESQLIANLDQILELTRDNKNLHVVGTLDIFKYTTADLAQLDSLMASRRIHGIKLYPGYQYFYPFDPIGRAVYKLCLKYDLPVIFHCGDTLSRELSAKVKYAHPLHIDEVAVDYPDLKIVIAHLGNPWLMDCAEVLYKNKNVYGDISGLFNDDQPPSSACAIITREKITELMTYCGPRKLIYGTDWPINGMAPYLKFANSLKLSKKDAEYVFSQNAIELFKLPV